MTESIIQPEADSGKEANEALIENTESGRAIPLQPTTATTPAKIIWTPRFIVIFTLTLVIGLSGETLLTQGWLNVVIPGLITLLFHVTLICGCWIVIVVFSNSSWTRIGGILGCIWAVFLSSNIVLNIRPLDPGLAILAHLNVVICIAQLGFSICFSLDFGHVRRWDIIVFALLFFLGGGAILLLYYLTVAEARSIEVDIAGVALILSSAVWLLRPSCWRMQPGPTFLFGLAPLLLLTIVLPNYILHESYFFLSQLAAFPIHQFTGSNETRFFTFQVALLCLLLGALRIARSEIMKLE